MPAKDFIWLVVHLLVPLACDFTKRWTPCQMLYKVFDYKSRKLFCRTHFSDCLELVNRTNLFGKQNISFDSMEIEKKNHLLANSVSVRLTFIEWRSALKKEGKKNFESKYHDVKLKSLKRRSTLVYIFPYIEGKL